MRGWKWPLMEAHLFSCAVKRERHCKQILLACVGSACSGWTTLGLPQPKVVCTSRVHTAQAPRCSARALSQVDPVFHTLPGLSHSGSRVLCKGTDTGGLCVLCRFQVQAAQATWCLVSAQSQVCSVSPLWGWSQAVKLLADVNCPGSQEDVVSHWQPSHSLVEDTVSRGNTAAAPCLPALAVAHLPLCLWGGRALSSSHLALLWYLPNPLFCDHTRVYHVALESFVGKVLFVVVSLEILWFGLLCHIGSLRLSSGHSSPVLTMNWWWSPCLLAQFPLAGGGWERLRLFFTGSCG